MLTVCLQLLGLPELGVEDGWELILLGTGVYVFNRADSTLTITR